MMKQQDQGLEMLGQSAERLSQISMGIHEELGNQNRCVSSLVCDGSCCCCFLDARLRQQSRLTDEAYRIKQHTRNGESIQEAKQQTSRCYWCSRCLIDEQATLTRYQTSQCSNVLILFLSIPLITEPNLSNHNTNHKTTLKTIKLPAHYNNDNKHLQNAWRNGRRSRSRHHKPQHGHTQNKRIDSKVRGQEEFHHYCHVVVGCGGVAVFDIVFVAFEW